MPCATQATRGRRAVVAAQVATSDDEDDDATHVAVRHETSNADALDGARDGEVEVLGGTSWLWAREEFAGRSTCCSSTKPARCRSPTCSPSRRRASSLVLLGDPQQLEQPQKGSHPDGVGVSALEHVLGGTKTMPADRGLFLPDHLAAAPAICAFTSELFYEGKLHVEAGLERQRLTGTGAVRRRRPVVAARRSTTATRARRRGSGRGGGRSSTQPARARLAAGSTSDGVARQMTPPTSSSSRPTTRR